MAKAKVRAKRSPKGLMLAALPAHLRELAPDPGSLPADPLMCWVLGALTVGQSGRSTRMPVEAEGMPSTMKPPPSAAQVRERRESPPAEAWDVYVRAVRQFFQEVPPEKQAIVDEIAKVYWDECGDGITLGNWRRVLPHRFEARTRKRRLVPAGGGGGKVNAVEGAPDWGGSDHTGADVEDPVAQEGGPERGESDVRTPPE